MMNTLALIAMVAFAPCAAPESPLAGRWVYKTELMTVVSTLLPDGRYHAETKVGDVTVPERGRHSVKGGKITLDPLGAAAVTFPYVLRGDTLIVTTPGAGEMSYTRTASAATVAAEAKTADEAKAVEDAEWRKKFAVVAMTVQPKHVAAGAVPEDPNAKRVFEKPEVFAASQLYLRNGQHEFVYAGGNPPGRFKTRFHWHFLPTGRVYVDAETYTGAVEVPAALKGALPTFYATGKTEQKKFGRYRIEKDELVFEMDDGEKATMELIDGRRNLVWGKAVYGNVVWELEALKKK